MCRPPSSTQAALPPREPALTTLAPGNFWVKLVIEVAGRGVRQMAADEHDDLLGVPGRRVPGLVHRRHDAARLPRAHLDDLVAQLGHIRLTLQVHRARVGPDPGRGHHGVHGTAVRGELELDDSGDGGRGQDHYPAQAQPEPVVIAATAAAADPPLGARAGTVRVGFPVPEQTAVLGLFAIFLPELGVRVQVLGGRLGGPGRRDLRPVQTMTGTHRGRPWPAGVRRSQERSG